MEKEDLMKKIGGRKLTCFQSDDYARACGNESTGVMRIEDEEADGWRSVTEFRVDREGRIVDFIDYWVTNDEDGTMLTVNDFVEGGYETVLDTFERYLEEELPPDPDPREEEVRTIFDSFGFAKGLKEAMKKRVGIKDSANPTFTFDVIREFCAEVENDVYKPYVALLSRRAELLSQNPCAVRDAAIAANINTAKSYEASFGMQPQEFVERFSRIRELLKALS